MVRKARSLRNKYPDVTSFLDSYADVHLSMEEKIEQGRRLVHENWDRLIITREIFGNECGKDIMRYLNSERGNKMSMQIRAQELHLERSQEELIELLGFQAKTLRGIKKSNLRYIFTE